ncbi:MAG: Gfo/Idh/MocA family oxidoreductase [Candidatus Ratteibacteria bacterium]|jgi:scyllo-inositol 2-dehydrogenase (NADP+)
MKKIRVGIIGQGRSGYFIHACSLKQLKSKFQVVAVSDPLEGRCDDAVKDFGCKAFTDYRKIFSLKKEIDLIVNASPSHLHVPISQEALNAGFNVLCEKPAASNPKDIDMLIALSKKKKRMYAVYQQSRFAPYYEALNKVLDSGVLGRIVMIKVAFNGFTRRWDWQSLQEYDGGSLLNTGPHPMDQVLMLFDPDAKVMPKVFCLMDIVNSYGNAEDHVKIILHGKGKPTIDFEVSSCAPYPLYTYQVFAEYGGLTGTMKNIEWKYLKPSEFASRSLVKEPLEGRIYCGEQFKWHTGSWKASKAQEDSFSYMSKKIYNNIYDVLNKKKGATLVVTPEQVRRQIAVIAECHKQAPLPKRKKKR